MRWENEMNKSYSIYCQQLLPITHPWQFSAFCKNSVDHCTSVLGLETELGILGLAVLLLRTEDHSYLWTRSINVPTNHSIRYAKIRIFIISRKKTWKSGPALARSAHTQGQAKVSPWVTSLTKCHAYMHVGTHTCTQKRPIIYCPRWHCSQYPIL